MLITPYHYGHNAGDPLPFCALVSCSAQSHSPGSPCRSPAPTAPQNRSGLCRTLGCPCRPPCKIVRPAIGQITRHTGNIGKQVQEKQHTTPAYKLSTAQPVINKTSIRSSKSVPASTRLEDPSRKGTTRTAKSAPFNPCPSREGPYSTVFSVSRPMDPLMWLAGLLALSGDVETNPGPTTQTWTCDMCSTEITGRQTSYKCNSSPSHWVHKHCTTLIRNTDYTPTWKCNIHNQQNNTITDQHHQLTDNSNNMQQNLNINQPHSINNNKTQQQINSKKTITIIQININGLTTKIHELKNLTDNTKIDIITIQETKLRPTHRTPYLKDYTAIRTDRTYKNGGGLMTYIKNDIIFTELKTPHTTNNKLTELQHIKIHLANHKHLNIFNIYIPS